jgi:carbamoyl-phosphate synthase large subunit
MMYRNLLITGCGGDIALALSDIARSSGIASRLVGCDITANHAGPAIFDACEVIPKAESPDYLDALWQLTERYDIDAIVPMSEAEIARLMLEKSLENFRSCDVIAANQLAVETGLDKYRTNQALIAAGLLAPWTVVVGQGRPASFPCILKPRYGQGSKGLQRVSQDQATMAEAMHGEDFIWQELILPDEAEYTCGLYRSSAGETRTIIFRRQLQGGITRAAWVSHDAAIETLLLRIADAVRLVGAINVQLRVDEDGPKVFEINPRFSSTVGFRHLLGFQDFIWSVQDRRGQSIGSYTPPPAGTAVYRGVSLLMVPPP